MDFKKLPRAAALLACLVCAACEPLYDGTYPGEPLLEVSGTATAASNTSGEVRAAMLWLSASPFGLALWADDVPLQTEFPAQWAVRIFEVPTDEQFPGRWEDVPFLPEEPGVRTLFGVLVAYEDTNDDGDADFDYSGYGLLSWLADPDGEDLGGLAGADELVGLASRFVVVAAEFDGEVLGESVDLSGFSTAQALDRVQRGLHAYRFDGDVWTLDEDADEVLLEID